MITFVVSPPFLAREIGIGWEDEKRCSCLCDDDSDADGHGSTMLVKREACFLIVIDSYESFLFLVRFVK